ncbi:MAG: MBL fold metallo-hydrolase [Thermomicrobiales bacterium]
MPTPTTSLTTLGGNAAGVGTGSGCSGSLVAHGGTRIVLDLGPDTLLELRKQTDIRALDGIVVSHLHLDHILDLFALRYTLAYAPGPLPRKIPLWLPPGGIAFFMRAGEAIQHGAGDEPFLDRAFEVHEYDPHGTLAIGTLTIDFQRSDHPVPCWSMRVNVPGGRNLLYTADTADIERLVPFGTGAHVLLAEATLANTPPPGTPRGHLSAEEAGTLAARLGVSALVLTHLWEENDPQRSIALARNAFQGDIIRAQPGVSIQW